MSAIRRLPDGLRIALRVMPRASANRIEGSGIDANGQDYLRIRVTVVPEDGKANAAVIRLLAKSWKQPRSAFEIVSGQTDRNKVIHLRGDPDILMEQIGKWFEPSPAGEPGAD